MITTGLQNKRRVEAKMAGDTLFKRHKIDGQDIRNNVKQ